MPVLRWLNIITLADLLLHLSQDITQTYSNCTYADSDRVAAHMAGIWFLTAESRVNSRVILTECVICTWVDILRVSSGFLTWLLLHHCFTFTCHPVTVPEVCGGAVALIRQHIVISSVFEWRFICDPVLDWLQTKKVQFKHVFFPRKISRNQW
jgi:hypothetical protein